jgi:hypothetical protein
MIQVKSVLEKKDLKEMKTSTYQHPHVCTCIYIIYIIVMREIAG